jgi:hypothetical protein
MKLMMDYGSYPLWDISATGPGDIDPRELPVSGWLCDRLEEWSASYDRTLNAYDPAASGWESPQALYDYDRDGRSIWVQLRSELGPSVRLDYFSGLAQRVIPLDDNREPAADISHRPAW